MQAKSRALAAALIATALVVAHAEGARAASAAEIEAGATAALENLYATTPGARALGERAKAILIFPEIVKGGFIVAGQYGDGVLRKRGRTEGFYRSVAASYGFQAGIETFGYALFFMDDASLNYLAESDGWELGVGPTLTIVNEGIAKNLSTTTLQSGVYAFIFNQQGLMGGLGIQGTKITRFQPNQY
jgi:lipid-binding SYLF domain-containing protein